MNNLETTRSDEPKLAANETSSPDDQESDLEESEPEESGKGEERDKVELITAIAEFKQAARAFISKEGQLFKINERSNLMLETQRIRIADPEKFRENMGWVRNTIENIQAAKEHLSASSEDLFNELSAEGKGATFVKMVTDAMCKDCTAIDKFQGVIDRLDY